MKKVFAVLIMIIAGLSVYAQKDVTKFLGIPVDGTKTEMIRKLKAKGFKQSTKGYMSGIFNGIPVNVFIATEKGKVSRIMVSNENAFNETDIKIQFNRLCHQFENNGKYMSIGENYSIPYDEDISYEITVRNKRYEATYFQLPEGETLETFPKTIVSKVASMYATRDWWDPTDVKLMLEILNEEIERAVKHKIVWFKIDKFYGKYIISIFYDNELNRAQGEDL